MADEQETEGVCRCRLDYVAIACNRTPMCVAWGRNGLVAYGGCHSVVLYRPEKENSAGAIENVLSGHKDRVNCIKWIQKIYAFEEDELVSGSTDKTAIVWRRNGRNWYSCAVLQGHDNSINSITAASIRQPDGSCRTLIVTASADSTAKIWERTRQEDQFTCIQTLAFGYGFVLSVDLSFLPDTCVPILACGCEDSKIHIFTEKESKFVKVQSLVGHEDWIRGTEFAVEDSGDLLLTSCSQDCFIRIWRISSSSQVIECKAGISNETENELNGDNEVIGELKLTSNLFKVMYQGKEREFSVVLESVLAGHEDVVYGVHWQPALVKSDGTATQPMCLLSSSLDKTLMIWRPDPESGVWLEMVRVGGVGGTTLGFYGGVFSPDGRSVLGHSYQGACHLWNNVATSPNKEKWEPGVTVGGHFGPVQDIAWDPEEGQFLLSVSSDQTTRLHAPWRREGTKTTWHEIARPQVHGYDMQCLTMITRYIMASGAEEKVVRIFKAPRQFLNTCQLLCNIQETNKEKDELPLGASIPALGLSNKAVFEGDLDSLKRDLSDPSRPMKSSAFASEEPAPFTPVALKVPPTEDVLLQNTLWPEAQKLYGHGYEIFCVTSSPDGTLLASCCKASKTEHACIILWDTHTWRQICTMSGHSLTVTQMAFSHSGQRLLTVSRDRTWAVFRKRKSDSEGPLYTLVSHSSSLKKAQQHARIIWSCSWSHDDKYFITASRDKKVIMWGRVMDEELENEAWQPVSSPLDVGEPVTAVDLAPCLTRGGRYVVAVGTESGRIVLYSWSADVANQAPSKQWTVLSELDQDLCHVLTVKRLRWKPQCAVHDGLLHLASCGADHSVKIFEISGLV